MVAIAWHGGNAMCEKCVEIDGRIERYRRLLLGVSDQVTVERAKELISELEAEKIALHPDKPGRAGLRQPIKLSLLKQTEV